MPKVTSRAAAASKRSAPKPSRLKTSGRKSLPKGATRKIARKRPGMAGRQAAELERYRLALEAMNLNTYDWDIVNNVVYISPAMREAMGFGPDQPLLSNLPKPKSRLPSAVLSKPAKTCSSCSTILATAWFWPTTISI